MRPSELVQMAYVARRFYLDGLTQVAIAQELGISRFTVAKVLEAAREHNVVRITVRQPAASTFQQLANEITQRFGLQHVTVVAASGTSQESVRAALAPAAADLLARTVSAADVLGFAGGRSVAAMVSQLSALPACAVVQLTGMGGALPDTSAELVRQVSALSGGRAYPMYVPLVASDASAAEAFLRQDGVREAFAKFAEVTQAIVAIGAWQQAESQLAAHLSPAERMHLLDAGVVAEICGTFFDRHGHVIPRLTDRVIAVSAEQLRQIPSVFAVAGGATKVEAMSAVLRSGLLSTLVTDADTAQLLAQS